MIARTSGTNATVAKASTYGASPVLINTFLNKVATATSFARQISVSQTRKKIRLTNATTVKKARISRFWAKIAKNKAR